MVRLHSLSALLSATNERRKAIAREGARRAVSGGSAVGPYRLASAAIAGESSAQSRFSLHSQRHDPLAQIWLAAQSEL